MGRTFSLQLPTFLILLYLTQLQLSVDGVTVVRLQADGQRTTSSYVDAKETHLPNMSQVALCLRFRFQQYSPAMSTFFSYAVSSCDNELMVGINVVTGLFSVGCCDFRVQVELPVALVALFTWHHLCVSLDLRHQFIQVLLDDLVLSERVSLRYPLQEEELIVKEGGQLVIGQEQDDLDGIFEISQSVNGDIADLLLYNTTLSLDQMKNYVACLSFDEDLEPLVQFDNSMTGLEVKGPSLLYNLTLDEVCSNAEREELVIFANKMEFKEAFAWCELLGGVLVVPSNKEENHKVYNATVHLQQQCLSSWGTFIWLGVRGSSSTGGWHMMHNLTSLSFSNFHPAFGTPGPLRNLCVTMGKEMLGSTWIASPCNIITCPLCQFKTLPVLRLQGSCTDSEFDNYFTVKNSGNREPVFWGYYRSRIIKDGNSWKLESTVSGRKSSAIMISGKNVNYPVGRYTWNLTSHECGTYQTEMLLTACKEGEYTCGDGTCVTLSQRCDQKVDCLDQSDENNCSIVRLPSGYILELPPPASNEKPLQLSFSQEIASIRDFSLVGFKVGMDVHQQVKWRDSRVSFQNLKMGSFSNKVKEVNKLWLPKFTVESDSRTSAEMDIQGESLLVQRDHQPLPDDLMRVTEDKMYSGDNNTMMLVQQYTITFTCHFELNKYPFDHQYCSLFYNIPHMDHMINVSVESVQFKGEHVLLEYEVVGVRASTYQTHEQSVVKVEVEFRNQYSYYVGNAFLPSVLLVIICYLTFWFRLDDFQDRIMVSLTSLLVLTGLLTQTSQSIPKTAYLKLIDVWYVVLICFDFAIFVVLVVIEGLRRQSTPAAEAVTRPLMKKTVYRVADNEENTPHLQVCFESRETRVEARVPPPIWSFEGEKQDGVHKANKLNQISVFVFPLISIIFFISFFTAAFSK